MLPSSRLSWGADDWMANVASHGKSETGRMQVLKCPAKPRLNRSVVEVCHALMSFGTRCPVLLRSDCFRPSDRLAGWDSHPLEIADFHGVLGC